MEINFVLPLPETKEEYKVRIRKEEKQKKKEWEKEKARRKAIRTEQYRLAREERIKNQSEYVFVPNHKGKKVRVKRKNAGTIRMRYWRLKKRILSQPHNTDMTTEPIEQDYRDQGDDFSRPEIKNTYDYDSVQERAVSKQQDADLPTLRRRIPNKWYGKNGKEFIKGMLEMAQHELVGAFMEVYQENPAKWLEIYRDLTKIAYPQESETTLKAEIIQKNDIYATLTSMSQASLPQAPQSALIGEMKPVQIECAEPIQDAEEINPEQQFM